MPSRYRTRLPVSDAELRAGGQDADEVQRVGAGQRHEGVGARLAPDLAQHADRLRQRELLAGKAGDEAAAADFAARFEPAIDAQQVAPRRQPWRLAFEQPPEHDAVAAQQRAREVLDGVIGVVGCLGSGGRARRASAQRPESSMPNSARPAAGSARLSAGISNARSPAKLSELTSPSATSSASASSICGRSSLVPSASSSKNEAPCVADEIGDGARAGAGLRRIGAATARSRAARAGARAA